MTREHASRGGGQGAGPPAAGAGPSEAAAGRSARVLADRVAAALVHHEPGWRLPRRSALARRYGVTAAQMEAAIEDLVGRRLLRRLPDGQVLRASPADCLIQLECLRDLHARIDPMGTPIELASRHASWRRVPEDIAEALGLPGGDPVCVVRCIWTVDGSPAACCLTYLPGAYAALADDPPALIGRAAQPAEADGAGRVRLRAADLFVEFRPPAPSAARSLRLATGQPAVGVAVRYDGLAGRQAALATAVLRPDAFRVVVESPRGPRASGAAGDSSWTQAAGGWEP